MNSYKTLCSQHIGQQSMCSVLHMCQASTGMHLRAIGCDMTADVTGPSSDNACKATKQFQPQSCLYI